ncbi:MAG: gamma-glutamyl-gamma-aminobutyrate hydrolase family protein [Acidimicrobiales bacterium]
MAAPLIGVSAEFTDVDIHDAKMPSNLVTNTYLKAVVKAGGVPVILPITTDPEAATLLADRVDGVVVTGGVDIDPAAYGAERDPMTGETQPDRDTFERALITRLIERNKPTLAICRGAQSLNVAMGGTLVQHVDGHMCSDRHNQLVHEVEIAPGSRLAALVGPGSFGVNSLHHQAIGRLGEGCRAVAINGDGHVEGIEVDGADRVIAVQWHPELLRHLPQHLALFQRLVEDAGAS